MAADGSLSCWLGCIFYLFFFFFSTFIYTPFFFLVIACAFYMRATYGARLYCGPAPVIGPPASRDRRSFLPWNRPGRVAGPENRGTAVIQPGPGLRTGRRPGSSGRRVPKIVCRCRPRVNWQHLQPRRNRRCEYHVRLPMAVRFVHVW